MTEPSEKIDLRAMLFSKAGGTLALRIAGATLQLAVAVLLARLLGVEGFGIYGVVIGWMALLLVPSQLGTRNLVIREASVSASQQDWPRLRGLLRWACLTVVAASAVVAIIAVAVSYIPAGSTDHTMAAAFRTALVLPFVMALLHVGRATLEGLHHPRTAQIPEMLVQPLALFLLIAAWVSWKGGITAQSALVATVLSFVLALICIWRISRSSLPRQVLAQPPTYQARVWLSSAIPLGVVGAMYIINTRSDIVMLGLMRGEVDAGVYFSAGRVAESVLFVIISINAVLSPHVARLYHRRQTAELKRVITTSARFMCVGVLGLSIVLVYFGGPILSIFGSEFTVGWSVLTILCAAQIVNAASGPNGQILIMSGHQREAAVGVTISALVNVILNFLFIPRWGIEGAASATAISMVLRNVILTWRIRSLVGIDSTILGRHPAPAPMNADERPDFFLVGAPKCATTAMCDFLSQHPNVFIPVAKEIHFFGSDFAGLRYVANLDAYLALFRGHEDELRGEGSVWYLFSKTAAEEIHSFNPDAKIVIMLRNPIDYVRSRHQQARYALHEDIPDLADALDAEEDRRHGRRIPEICRHDWNLLYVETARFSEQVERYMNVFGREQVHVILFDDFAEDTLKVYRELVEFLGVDAEFVPDVQVVNPSKKIRSRLFQRLITNPKLRSLARAVVPQRWQVAIGQSLMEFNAIQEPKAPLDPDLRRRLAETFQSEVQQLGELLGRDLSHWCRLDDSQK